MNNRESKLLLLCILIVGCIATSIAVEYFAVEDKPLPAAATQASTQREQTIKIYVSGAVQKPGIYDVPVNSRAYDAVEIAGGFTEKANLEKVNLAKKLKDGSQVNVPSLSARQLKERQLNGAENSGANSASGIAAENQLVNINTAQLDELDTLPGVGTVTAQNIIDFRKERPFEKIEDIMLVNGIGKAKFAQLKSRITI